MGAASGSSQSWVTDDQSRTIVSVGALGQLPTCLGFLTLLCYFVARSCSDCLCRDSPPVNFSLASSAMAGWNIRAESDGSFPVWPPQSWQRNQMASSTGHLPCVISGMVGHSRGGDTTHPVLPDPPHAYTVINAVKGSDCAVCWPPRCPATYTTTGEPEGAVRALPAWEEARHGQGVPSKTDVDEQPMRRMGLHAGLASIWLHGRPSQDLVSLGIPGPAVWHQ